MERFRHVNVLFKVIKLYVSLMKYIDIDIYIYVFPSKASSVVFVVSVVFVGSVSAVKIGEAGMGKVSTWQPHAVANGRRR